MANDVDEKTNKCKYCGRKLAYVENAAGEKIYQPHSCPKKQDGPTVILSARWGL